MIPKLPDSDLLLKIDPSSLKDTILGIVQFNLDTNPRSLQAAIGASEIGTPCTRKLIYKLGQVESTNPQNGTWQQGVGTILHNGLAEMLAKENSDLIQWDRWVTEEKVTIGTFGDQVLTGHLDTYDRLTGNILDWKFLGKTSLAKMKKNNHPGETYRTQLQCYGKGIANLGLPVTHVHVLAFPQSGNLKDAFHWSEPYDPTVAEAALLKAEQLVTAGAVMGFGRLAALASTADDYCDHCPWFRPDNPDPAEGQCPGSSEVQAERTRNARSSPPKRAFG